MNWRRAFLVLFLFFTTVLVVVLISSITDPKHLEILVALLIPPILSLFGYAVAPIGSDINAKIEGVNSKKVCTVCFYGRAGSGKTTLIKKFFDVESAVPESTTPYLAVYRGKITTDLVPGKEAESVRVQVVDYRGQEPTQLCDPRIPKVDFIVFVVDVVGRSDNPHKPTKFFNTQSAQIEWLSNGALEKIDERIIQHREYINGSLLFVLEILSNPKLRGIRLVINKMDLIEYLIRKNYEAYDSFSEDEKTEHLQSYANHLFKGIIDELKRASEKTGLAFSIDYVGNQDRLGLYQLKRQILRDFKTIKISKFI